MRTRGRTRRYAGVLGAALAVAGLALGIGAVQVLATGSSLPSHDTAELAGSPAAEVVRLDVGPVGTAAVKACLSPDFAAGPEQVTVAYGVEQRTRTGSAPVLVLRNRAGETLLCDQFGRDRPARAPAPHATRRHPVAFASTGRRVWTCDGHTIRRFVMTEWLSTAPAVRSVRLRFVVDGAAGPWFVTRPANGLAHLGVWLDGPVPRGTRVVVQQQVRGAHGRLVRQHVLPGRERLVGCLGGSAQIG